jgi:hypothetical protein
MSIFVLRGLFTKTVSIYKKVENLDMRDNDLSDMYMRK